VGCRVVSAMRRACSVRSPVKREPIAQPMTAREYQSSSTARYSQPSRVVKADKGCQFTSQDFTGLLNAHDIQISMDGTGRWRDNVFVERLWPSLKYEEVYLHAYETVRDAQDGVARYLTFYNQVRPHRALEGRTPEDIYT